MAATTGKHNAGLLTDAFIENEHVLTLLPTIARIAMVHVAVWEPPPPD